ncbi:phage tail protein [Nocardioides halotolerans]|jgi:microcystin-dependent protein|uniref:phage tail protein n=1 Tax=Nocardioides halotolerans TaxID=433660 RepID=UPI00040F8733|nr:tail fiber protein [Nocardioides halotolerans]
MAQPYVGEVRIFAGNFAPAGWAFCNGQPLAISEYETLFQLIGTTYGGDGQSTFNVPDLRGRLGVHKDTPIPGNYPIGSSGGVETVTLTTTQIPSHRHAMLVSTGVATQSSPANNVLAQSTAADLYIEDTATAALAASSMGTAGGSQPHDNLQPYLCINHIISLFGIFPSPT